MMSKQLFCFIAVICISVFTETVYSQTGGNSLKIPDFSKTKYLKVTELPELKLNFALLDKFDGKFFNNEKATNTSIDAFTQYIKTAIAEFQSYFTDEALRFRDLKQKLLQIIPQYKVEKSFPLPNTSHTLTTSDQKLSATVTLFDVSLSGLNYTSTSKQPAFYALFTSDVITVTGQYAVKISDESIDGKFSYDVVNFANLIYLNSTTDDKHYTVHEISDFDSIKQGNIEFSSAPGTKEALVRELLPEAFNQSLLQTYIPTVFSRYRNIFDSRSIVSSGEALIIQDYGTKFATVLLNLMQLYLEKFYNVVKVTDVNGKTIEFENIAKLYHISHQVKNISDDGLIVQVKITTQFVNGATIHYDSAKYSLQYLYADFTIKLKSSTIENADIIANTENINVLVSTIIAANGEKYTDPEVTTTINSAIKEGFVHFLQKIYSQSQIN